MGVFKFHVSGQGALGMLWLASTLLTRSGHMSRTGLSLVILLGLSAIQFVKSIGQEFTQFSEMA